MWYSEYMYLKYVCPVTNLYNLLICAKGILGKSWGMLSQISSLASKTLLVDYLKVFLSNLLITLLI